MLDYIIYERLNKIFRYDALVTADLTIIETLNKDNNVINNTNVTETVTYYRKDSEF
jgi:hypothetical protein